MTKPVGYGSPPDHTKWQKGQSGNPSGRRKGQRNLATDLARELAATISVTENGRVVAITKQAALVKTLLARALKGDVRAMVELIRQIERSAVVNRAIEAAETAEIDVSAEDQAIIAAFKRRANEEGSER